MKEKLRFAPLIRVSTESQEKRGESLQVQKKQIERFVKLLNGTIPKSCWRYSGQEHATVDQERVKLDRLLQDSGKGIFDAIICCDATRWSRDNEKSKAGLNLLRENGIKFFVGTSEYNLFNPEQTFFLSVAVEIGEFHANQQASKSINSRIDRAKEGKPSAGKLPYGRTFNKDTGKWGIDKKKKRIIERIAKEYLAGAKGEKLAKKNGMNYPNLLKILKHRCGDTFEISFKSKKLNIDETVPIKVPRLLSDETIKAIHERAAANKTFTHGQIKNPYPLGRMIFCGHCNYAMPGQVNHLGKRYYRHPRGRKNGCKSFIYVPANIVEDSVLFNLFSFFGDKEKMEQAAKDAIPDLAEVEEMKGQIADNKKDLASIKIKKGNVLTAIEDLGLHHGDIKKRYKDLAEREDLLNDEIADLSSKIREFPTEEEISIRSQLIQRTMQSDLRSKDHLKEMTFDDKRAFFQSVFGGQDRDGKRFGVYVSQYEKKDGKTGFEFRLKGNLITPDINDKVYPLSNREKEAIMDVPKGFFDDKDNEKLNMDSKCHAYNGIGIYQRR